MKLRKRLIALSMAAACAATAFAGAAYTDQSSIKVESKVLDRLTERNVIKGYEDGSFKPNKIVTRAEMAKMNIVRMSRLQRSKQQKCCCLSCVTAHRCLPDGNGNKPCWKRQTISVC